IAPAAAPTPVPMRAPLPAPYPVPYPTAAPAPAPTAAPVTVPQAATATASVDTPTSLVMLRLTIISSLLSDLPLQTELARRRGRRRAHEGAARRARLPAPGHLDVGPPVGRGANHRRGLLPQLLVIGLGEHHRPAQAHPTGDRADDLEHPHTLAAQVLELRATGRRGCQTRGIREVAGLELRVCLCELRRLRGGAERRGRPCRQHVGKFLSGLARRRLVEAAGHLAVSRGRTARGRRESLDAHRAVGALANQSEDARGGHVDDAVELSIAVGVQQADLGGGGRTGCELGRQLLADLIGALTLQADERDRARLVLAGAQLAAPRLHGIVDGGRHVLAADAGRRVRGRNLGGDGGRGGGARRQRGLLALEIGLLRVDRLDLRLDLAGPAEIELHHGAQSLFLEGLTILGDLFQSGANGLGPTRRRGRSRRRGGGGRARLSRHRATNALG